MLATQVMNGICELFIHKNVTSHAFQDNDRGFALDKEVHADINLTLFSLLGNWE